MIKENPNESGSEKRKRTGGTMKGGTAVGRQKRKMRAEARFKGKGKPVIILDAYLGNVT